VPNEYFGISSDVTLYNKVKAQKNQKNKQNVPNGFHVNLEKMPTEGEDLKLSCTVNKFLYRDVTWILMRIVNNRTMHYSISKQKMAITKEHSIILNLTIKNVSLEDSGTYACRARNVYTGEEILKKKEVTIR
ncbi:Vascular endothelial growth factor receptor 1, partial [Saguinus oedipus]